MTNPAIFNDVWQNGRYRLGSTADRLIPFLVERIPPDSVINDYDSGTGRADVKLLDLGYSINMVDFADVALEQAPRSRLCDRLTYQVAPLWSLPGDFPIADFGICINVLMTVDPSRLDDIQKEMRRTCRNLIVEVYDWPDIRLGIDMTTIKGDAEWWASEMSKYWPCVGSFESPEHKHRFITICQSSSK
jgi:hypothetical protein